MARNPNYQATITVIDQSAERSTFTHPTADAVAVPGDGSLPAGFQLWLEVLGEANLHTLSPVNFTATNAVKLTNVSVGTGNREDKLRYVYQDNTTLALFSLEIPCRVGGLTTSEGTDRIPRNVWQTVQPTAGVSVQDQFQTITSSPDGNPVTLIEIILVGRNI